jgi:hypothetical protein
LAACVVCFVALGAGAPAPPSFDGVTKSIEAARAEWSQLEPNQAGAVPGWSAYLDSISAELGVFRAATTDEDRRASLEKLAGLAAGLRQSAGGLQLVRTELEEWLRPRRAVHDARSALLNALAAFAPPTDDADAANRKKWQTFLDERLLTALTDYERASTLSDRHAAGERLTKVLADLRERNAQYQWQPALFMAQAMGDYCDRPNLDIAIDNSFLANSIGRRGIVAHERIYFRDQWSTVTPGAVQGVGFVPNGNGITVQVRQAMTSITPVQGFHEQLAADARGKRAAKLYTFGATTRNDGVAILQATIDLPFGVRLQPMQLVNFTAAISSVPTPGGGMGRLFASLLGQSQTKITQKVYEGAIGRMRQEAISGTAELSSMRASSNNATLNDQIRPYIVDDRTVAYGSIGITKIQMQSWDALANITGMLGWHGAGMPVSAGPQPSKLMTYVPGVTVDLHVGSVLSNLAHGYLDTESAREVKTILLETGMASADRPLEERLRTTTNADESTFLKAVDEANASGDRNRRAIRVKKPDKPPIFAADARGRLVAMIDGFEIDVPAPSNMGNAKAFRIVAPKAEVSLEIDVLPQPGAPPRIKARVVEFDPGRDFKAYELGKGEPRLLNAIQSRVLVAGLSAGVEQQVLDVPLSGVALPGLALASASPLDPSGWMRVVLVPVP